jgi:hypothetical protein
LSDSLDRLSLGSLSSFVLPAVHCMCIVALCVVYRNRVACGVFLSRRMSDLLQSYPIIEDGDRDLSSRPRCVGECMLIQRMLRV